MIFASIQETIVQDCEWYTSVSQLTHYVVRYFHILPELVNLSKVTIYFYCSVDILFINLCKMLHIEYRFSINR